MTTFTVKFDTDNAAFEPDPSGEIVRILHAVADQVERGEVMHTWRTIFDINGNDVGRWKLVPQRELKS